MQAEASIFGIGPAGPGRPLTVSQLTSQIRLALEQSLPRCWVIGELSEYTHHSSGHRYFALKDASCQLSAVMFRGQGRRLDFVPQVGMQVMAYGRVSVYERGGRYQFYAELLQPAGQGELAAAFERLKATLEAQGLFAAERKRPLPRFPRSIGVVTSASGAAIRDILSVLSRRAPGVRVILRPAAVQGPGAAEQIAAAIDDLNRFGGVDILIVGRGGGSPEDLWPFNEELVARAIYRSARPVISAVGHEVDYTIADYVADYRAPTPSAAAEVVVQERVALLRQTRQHWQRLGRAMAQQLAATQRRIDDASPQRLLSRLQDRVNQSSQYVDERRRDLAAAFDWFARDRQQALARLAAQIEALSPLAHLARGYAVCQRRADAAVVRDARQLCPGEMVDLRFLRGRAAARVEELPGIEELPDG